MNTQRFVWAATILLFTVIGAVVGWIGGVHYIKLDFVRGVNIASLVPPILLIGGAIVGARFGSWLADRHLLPALHNLSELSVADRVLGVTGALVGLVFGVLVTLPLGDAFGGAVRLPLTVGVMLVCAALGMAFFGSMRGEIVRAFPRLSAERDEAPVSGVRPKFLDTNIIIDGRLAEICATGFVDGPLYVPSFVLDEVQHIADSSDSMRRARGRRGLDVLNLMREMIAPHATTEGESPDVPLVHLLHEFSPTVNKIHAVDSKLVALAREKGGVIVTNDFNLNKVAELQGVPVLNLNQLAQALKPVVLPGEEMQVTLVKEGKESHQAVGYLEDGTMVVVSHAVHRLGDTVSVVIATVYQTVAGKMIFADLPAEAEEELEKDPAGPGDDLFSDNRRGRDGSRDNGRERGPNDAHSTRSGGGLRRKSRAER